MSQLLVVFSSLSLLLSELGPLEETALRCWAALAEQPLALRRGAAGPLQQPLFEQASLALLACRRSVGAHMSHLIVFAHLKSSFVEQAYAFTLSADSRLPAALLDPLNVWMERVCARLSDEERAVFGGAVADACALGLRHILLDGGPTRFFARSDAAAIREDCVALHDFLTAGGEGLDAATAELALQPVLRIVELMQLDSPTLFSRYTAAKGDAQTTLLHVLSHRAEREASKLLKESLGMPKPVGRLNLLLGPRVKKT